MKKEELLKAFAYANMLWSTFALPADKDKKILLSQLWYSALKVYPLEVVYAGMREHARKSDFVNIMKIAEECRVISNLSNSEIKSEDEILQEIERAVCSSDKRKAFEKLSVVARKVVGTPEQLQAWAQLQAETYDTVVVSNLKRSIRTQMLTQEKTLNIFRECPQILQNSTSEYLPKADIKAVNFGGGNDENI